MGFGCGNNSSCLWIIILIIIICCCCGGGPGFSCGGCNTNCGC